MGRSNMPCDDSSTEQLLDRAGSGSRSAVQRLLGEHRDRLRRMVGVRLDPRMSGRVDPSDVVQETLAEAARKLPDYLRHRPVPFYPWLRQLAWEQLVDLHRRHVQAQKRSVTREVPLPLPDQSTMELAQRLMAAGPSPSGQMIRAELVTRVRDGLDRLPTQYREVLVLRYLEQLSTGEIAAVLHVSMRTVQARHRQALEQLEETMADSPDGDDR